MCFQHTSLTDAKRNIRQFLRSILIRTHLQRGIDYIITTSALRIRHAKSLTGRILITLQETFPLFCFYWQTPRMLVWV